MQRCATVRGACVSEGAAGAQRRCRKRGSDLEQPTLEITLKYRIKVASNDYRKNEKQFVPKTCRKCGVFLISLSGAEKSRRNK